MKGSILLTLALQKTNQSINYSVVFDALILSSYFLLVFFIRSFYVTNDFGYSWGEKMELFYIDG